MILGFEAGLRIIDQARVPEPLIGEPLTDRGDANQGERQSRASGRVHTKEVMQQQALLRRVLRRVLRRFSKCFVIESGPEKEVITKGVFSMEESLESLENL